MAEANDGEDEIQAFTREIDKAKKMRRALVKLKHRLETKLKIPCSATFKEYESFGKVDQLKNNYTSVALASCRAKLELCLIACGIKWVDVNDVKMLFELCFSVGRHISSGYLIQIEVESEGFHLAKYYLPDGLDVKTIVQKVPMKGIDDMIKFLNFVRACSCALLHRRNQVEELQKYCADKGVDIDVFTSCDVTLIDIGFQSDILMLTSKTEKISFMARYDIDAYLPSSTVYEKEHMNREDKSTLGSCCSDFLTLSLVDAFRCAKHVKRQPLESTTKQLKQGTLQFRAMTTDSKLSKDQAMSRRTQKQTALESKSFESAASSSRHTSVHVQRFSEDNVESRPKSTSPRRISTRTQKVQKFSDDDVESMRETTSPRRVSIHTQKTLGEKVESRTKTGSPRRKSILLQIFSDDDDVETMQDTTSPRHISTRAQKVPKEKVESRTKTASPRRKLIHMQKFSDDFESMSETTSPRPVSTRTQKVPGEKVESRTKTVSPRRKSIHVQILSDDEDVESMRETTSPRYISTRAQKMPEEKVESRTNTVSPTRKLIRLQKFLDDSESMPETTSPRYISTRTQKMRGEKVESRTKTVPPRRKSIRVQISSDDDDETVAETASPRRVPTRTQNMPEENESRIKSASPKRTSQGKKLSGRDGVELRLTSSSKQVPIHTQQIPMKSAVVVLSPMAWIPEHTQDHLISNLQQRQFFPQKSSTPLRMYNTAQEKHPSDVEINDLSTIMGSDTNVQSLSKETENGYPVAASTPFVQSNLRQKRINVTEKKQNSDHLQMVSPQIHSHKYRQTRLHQFIKNQHAQEINKFIRTSPRKKSNPGRHSSESNVDDDENEYTEIEKKRKSGINVHKSTPVPKGFQTSRVKKSVTRHSVVTGKRLRKKTK